MKFKPEDAIVVDTTNHYDCFGDHTYSIEMVMLHKHLPMFLRETVESINKYHVDKYDDPTEYEPATAEAALAKIDEGKVWNSVPDDELWSDHYSISIRLLIMWEPKE